MTALPAHLKQTPRRFASSKVIFHRSAGDAVEYQWIFAVGGREVGVGVQLSGGAGELKGEPGGWVSSLAILLGLYVQYVWYEVVCRSGMRLSYTLRTL
jgi:hypothetical protein